MKAGLESQETYAPRLTRVTLAYNLEEDRLQVTGEDEQGETSVFWLTARLLLRLVPHLVWQQDSLAETPEASANADRHANKEAAVRRSESSPEVLVTAVDVTTSSDHVTLTFKGARGTVRATFALSAPALKGWLQGVKHCFEQAGWPQTVFHKERDAASSEGLAVTIH